MSDVTIELVHPVTVNNETITSLNLRRPKVRDMLIADKTGVTDGTKEVTMFANLCEVDVEVIHELDLIDYHKVQETYQGFLS